MTIKRVFKQKYKFPNIAVDRFYIGIFLGILTAVTFYLFFNVSREIMRITFSANKYYDLWVLTDRETWFYNLIFALISSSFGQGICFKTWFEGPNRAFSNSYFDFKRKVMYNDSMFFNVNFLNLFAKTSVLYGLWYGEMSGYLLLDKTLKYNFIWIIIVIVLHLEQWKTIRRVFRKAGLKGFFIFTTAILLISFLLSFINPIDYKSFNSKFISNSIEYNYQLERPESKYARVNFGYSLTMNLYFIYPKNNINHEEIPIILFKKERILLDSLTANIERELYKYNSWELHRLKVHIHCDKATRMKHIKALKEQIAKAGIDKISLAVIPEKREYPAKVYRYHGLESSLPDYSNFKENHFENVASSYKNEIIKIEINSDNLVKVNDCYVQIDNLQVYLKQLHNSKTFKEIVFYTNDNVEYGTYILVRDKLNKTINHFENLKKKELEDFYETPFNLLELMENHNKE